MTPPADHHHGHHLGLRRPAIGAAVIALPAEMILHDIIVHAFAKDVGIALPGSFVHIYQPAGLLLLAPAGLAIAAADTLLLASCAAASKAATDLHAE
jgi:hypothetical protein